MKPVLYNADEFSFNSNGIGVLADVISAPVYREINGQYELTLTYPAAGINADFLVDEAIILTKPDPYSSPQPFRIYRVAPVYRDNITVYAHHVAYDLQRVPVAPFAADNLVDALKGIVSNAVVSHPFYLWSNKGAITATWGATVPKSAWDLLGGSEGSILDTYGGEWDFDYFRLGLRSRLGENRGMVIRYGENLRTLEQDRNCAAVYDGIYPYWLSSEGLLMELSPRVIDLSGTGDPKKVYILDLSAEWDDMPTVDELQARAISYASDNGITKPKVSWKIRFDLLAQSAEYAHLSELERVQLGDDVRAIFPRMGTDAAGRMVEIDGPAIDVTARVVATTFDSINEQYNDITLGRVKDNLEKTIVSQNKQIAHEAQINATRIAKVAIASYDASLDQLKVLAKLTKDGTVQGIWTVDGNIYINGEVIQAGTLRAKYLGLDGKFSAYGDGVLGGYIGYMAGATDTESTDGIGVSDASETSKFVATNAGARIQSGTTKLFLTKDGSVTVVGTLKVKGSILYTGSLEKIAT